MRGLLIVAAGAGAMIAMPVSAQHSGGGSWHSAGHGARWGGTIGGRWARGARAPEGRAAYRRPMRGGVLPSYWAAPGWTVSNWAAYGLPAPPRGYRWSRYYDDAVLIDGSGQVWDSRDGVDWESYDRGYDDGRRDAAEDGGAHRIGPPPPPAAPPPPGVRYGPDVSVTRGGVPVEGARVTTTCVGDCRGEVRGGWFYPPATETTITIPPGRRAVTTTTTTHPARAYIIERPAETVRNAGTRRVIRK